MLENDKTIILDNTNNVFVGPNGYFKVVIEDFDGETVKSWYVEDAEGNKTENLAKRAGGKHIDLLLGKANRTVSSFIDKIQNDLTNELTNELKEKIKELEAKIKK